MGRDTAAPMTWSHGVSLLQAGGNGGRCSHMLGFPEAKKMNRILDEQGPDGGTFLFRHEVNVIG